MGFWDRVREALGREAKEAQDVVSDATARGNTALDGAERELHATPEEKIAIEQERIAASDAEFDALRQRIETQAATPQPPTEPPAPEGTNNAR